MQIWEMENSKNLLERLNFVKRVKEIIELKEKADIPALEKEEPENPLLKQEKDFVRMLKDKLSRFDVYSQKSVYKCSGCREPVDKCVCDETGGEEWIKGLDL
jgi:hypothetical protein